MSETGFIQLFMEDISVDDILKDSLKELIRDG